MKSLRLILLVSVSLNLCWVGLKVKAHYTASEEQRARVQAEREEKRLMAAVEIAYQEGARNGHRAQQAPIPPGYEHEFRTNRIRAALAAQEAIEAAQEAAQVAAASVYPSFSPIKPALPVNSFFSTNKLPTNTFGPPAPPGLGLKSSPK